MFKIAFLITFILLLQVSPGMAQETEFTHLTGVYQGKTLFIQNPYDSKSKAFCVKQISVNDRLLSLNYRVSAIKLDFPGVDLNVPVTIRIEHEAGCVPIVINPDAIFYHSMFSFREIALTDTALVWRTAGERVDSYYIIEKYENGVWFEVKRVEALGNFGEAQYAEMPEVDEGPNKFRIKYVYPSGDHLYSREIDFHYYREPVTFSPHKVKDEIKMSRTARYVIFDRGNKIVLSGEGSTIDVRQLPSGEYIVYFDDKDPGVFTKL